MAGRSMIIKAYLCRISPDQAYRLLKSLMLKSKIRMQGTKKGPGTRRTHNYTRAYIFALAYTRYA